MYLEAQRIPQPQERQPYPSVAAASVLGPATLRLCHVHGSPLVSGSSLSSFTSSPLPGQPSSSPQGAIAKPRSRHKGSHQPQPIHSIHLPRQLPVPLGSKMGSAYLYACRDWEVGDIFVRAHRLRFHFPRGVHGPDVHAGSGGMGFGVCYTSQDGSCVMAVVVSSREW